MIIHASASHNPFGVIFGFFQENIYIPGIMLPVAINGDNTLIIISLCVLKTLSKRYAFS
jgi:hypothetical protein